MKKFLSFLLVIMLLATVLVMAEVVIKGGSRFNEGTKIRIPAANYRVEVTLTNIDTSEEYDVITDTMSYALEGDTITFYSIIHGDIE